MGDWLERNKGIVIISLILITLFGGVIVYARQPEPAPLEITTPEPASTNTAIALETATPKPTGTPAPLRVYITGEVKQPDVYFLPPGNIIRDALKAAGGATDEADLRVVNLAQELRDQQQITIPSKADNLPTPEVIRDGVEPSPQPADDLKPGESSDGQPAAGDKININSADLATFTTLSGIGPALGQRIIDYRTDHGKFASIEELMNVKGIGPATFEKLKDQIMVEEIGE